MVALAHRAERGYQAELDTVPNGSAGFEAAQCDVRRLGAATQIAGAGELPDVPDRMRGRGGALHAATFPGLLSESTPTPQKIADFDRSICSDRHGQECGRRMD